MVHSYLASVPVNLHRTSRRQHVDLPAGRLKPGLQQRWALSIRASGTRDLCRFGKVVAVKRGMLILLAIGCAVAGVYLFSFSARPSYKALEARYRLGDLSETLAEIESQAKLSDELQFLASQCYRQLGNVDGFRRWLVEAEQLQLRPSQLQLAKDLFDTQVGAFDETPARQQRELERRGASNFDAREVVLRGLLAQGRLDDAIRLLDTWPDTPVERVQKYFLSGLLALAEARTGDAQAFLFQAIELNPRHEPSLLALAAIYSSPPLAELDKSRWVLEQCLQFFPHNQDVRLQLARLDREQGELASAEMLLKEAIPTEAAILESAEVALDAGQYADSVQLLSQADLRAPQDIIALVDAAFGMNVQGRRGTSGALTRRASWAATALALSGRRQDALLVFEYSLDRVARIRRFVDLQIQRQLSPSDQAIVDELNAVLSPAYAPNYPTLSGHSLEDRPPNGSEGQLLYREHCAGCHGENGNGLGPAARHLFPAPRNFRDEPMRMVSSVNRLATDEDLQNAIKQGLGGASMPAFADFSPEQLKSIVAVVRQFQQAGLSDQYDSLFDPVHQSDMPPADAKQNWIDRRLIAGGELELPELPEQALESSAAEELLRQFACQKCHRLASDRDVRAIDARQIDLFDALGRPLVARDLYQDAYRGGNSVAAIYRRLVLGIPGTPHPASSDLSVEQLWQLAATVAGLNRANSTATRSTNHERRLLVSEGEK